MTLKSIQSPSQCLSYQHSQRRRMIWDFGQSRRTRAKSLGAMETSERLSERRKPPSHSCPLSYPLSLCLGFSFSSRLIVLVEACVEEEAGLSEAGSLGKVSLLESSAFRRRSRCRQGGLWVLAIKAGAVEASSGFCHQGGCGCVWGS